MSIACTKIEFKASLLCKNQSFCCARIVLIQRSHCVRTKTSESTKTLLKSFSSLHDSSVFVCMVNTCTLLELAAEGCDLDYGLFYYPRSHSKRASKIGDLCLIMTRTKWLSRLADIKLADSVKNLCSQICICISTRTNPAESLILFYLHQRLYSKLVEHEHIFVCTIFI